MCLRRDSIATIPRARHAVPDRTVRWRGFHPRDEAFRRRVQHSRRGDADRAVSPRAADAWLSLAGREGPPHTEDSGRPLTGRLLTHLRIHGASFANDLAVACELNDEQLRAADCRPRCRRRRQLRWLRGPRSIAARRRTTPPRDSIAADASGRGLRCARRRPTRADADIETLAWTLLRRYGVVFRRVLTREAINVPWRELAAVYRRLEARGEIRGGRS